MLALITGWPLVQLVIMSFQEFGRAQVFGAPPEWVWFDNYANVLTDPVFWAVLVPQRSCSPPRCVVAHDGARHAHRAHA